MPQYRLGGVDLLSDVTLGSLPPVGSRSSAVAVRLLVSPHSGEGDSQHVEHVVDHFSPGEADPYLRVGRTATGHSLEHVEGVVMRTRDDGHTVSLTHVSPSLSSEQLEHILLDQMLPLVFAHLGRLSFHGSGVEVDGRGLCFLASSRTGKSTLAAALVAHAGGHLIADDEIVVEEVSSGFVAHPSYPSVRLWDESAKALFGAPSRPRKHRFGLEPAAGPTPLAAMVLLEPGHEAQVEAVEAETLRTRDGLVGIAVHLDRLDPTDRRAMRREIESLSRLASSVPILRMRVVRQLARLPEVAALVRGWAARCAPLDPLRP